VLKPVGYQERFQKDIVSKWPTWQVEALEKSAETAAKKVAEIAAASEPAVSYLWTTACTLP